MERVSATEAGRQLSELINRVKYRGESFIITRNGEDVAGLTPVPARLTLRDLLDLVARIAPDDGFADDLAQIQSQQGRPESPSWPS